MVDIEVYAKTTCAILDDGSVSCWGKGSAGQLGNGATDSSNTPVDVSLPANRTAVRLSEGYGSDTPCVILDDRSAVCWGVGALGQLGNNDTANSDTPVAIQMPSDLGLIEIIEVK